MSCPSLCSFPPISHNLLPPSSSGWSNIRQIILITTIGITAVWPVTISAVHWLLFEDMQSSGRGEKFCTKIAMSRRVIEASKPSDRSCLWSLRSTCTLEISHLHLHQWPACLLVADTFQSLREVIPKLKASSMYVVARDLIAMSLAHWLKGMRTDIKANLCSTGLRSTSLNWHCSTGSLLPGSRTGITSFYWSFEIFWCIE